MKKAGMSFLTCILAFGLLTGCSGQDQKTAGAAAIAKETKSPVTYQAQSGNAVRTCGISKPGSSNADTASGEENRTISETAEKLSPNAGGDTYGAVFGMPCDTDKNKQSVVPSVNGELDLDKDGTISKTDYLLSGMSCEDFATKLVLNGNVGTAGEAELVIKGEIAVMCGIFNGPNVRK